MDLVSPLFMIRVTLPAFFSISMDFGGICTLDVDEDDDELDAAVVEVAVVVVEAVVVAVAAVDAVAVSAAEVADAAVDVALAAATAALFMMGTLSKEKRFDLNKEFDVSIFGCIIYKRSQV